MQSCWIYSWLFFGVVAAGAAHAQNIGDFYPPNIAKTTFAPAVEKIGPPDVSYFPDQSYEDSSAQGATDSSSKPIDNSSPQLNQNQPRSRASILAKYGDPNKPVPILGKQDAPDPFKGMMECLEIEDEECARQYAKQFVHYMEKFQKRNSDVTALMGGVLKDEKQASQSGALSAPELIEARTAQSELELRKKIRLQMSKVVAVDPEGEVDIVVFLGLNDADSRRMLSEIQSLYEAAREDHRIGLSVLTVESATAEQIQSFVASNGIQFSIEEGSAVAQKLGVTKTPATLFVTHNTRKQFLDVGVRSFTYIDELIRVMQGDAAQSDESRGSAEVE